MSWLFFLDESGHDHRLSPYEVRGGIALHMKELWPFEREMDRLELDCFGTHLRLFQSEIKGAKLLRTERFRWAAEGPAMDAEERRRLCRIFLTKGLEKKPPASTEFVAFGQASLEMARGVMELLRDPSARLFATAIPRGTPREQPEHRAEHLRKDHVFLFERFFYFLEEQRQHGVIVMDESDKVEDRRFVNRLHGYFTKTLTGRQRTAWVVPTPLFVSSGMNAAIQAADLCLYCINWGYRMPRGMDAVARAEIQTEFTPYLRQLEWKGDGHRQGEVFRSYGVVFVPDILENRIKTKTDPMPSEPPESRP